MSFGNILGQMLQDGLGGQSQARLGNTLKSLGLGDGQAGGQAGGGQGGGLEGVLGQLQAALGGARAPGGVVDKARDFMTEKQVGGMSGAQLGGIGALAGALLGGGVGGAARGGALAVLGTLAVNALRQAQAQRAAAQPAGGQAGPIAIEASEVEVLTSPDNEKLLVRAMVSAAKADGSIDQKEMERIIGRIGEGGVTDEEKAFVMGELGKPVDVAALAAEARTPTQAAEVYAASLIAIDLDSDAERAYLRDLAQALRLDAATVSQLHGMTGAPAI